MNDVGIINIVKILNLPVENNGQEAIDVKIKIDEANGAAIEARIDSIVDLVKQHKIVESEKYTSHALFVVDEKGQKYTLLDVCFNYFEVHSKHHFNFVFYGILYDEHIDDIYNRKFDKAELKITYKRPLYIDFEYDNMSVVFTPIFAKKELSQEELELYGDYYKGDYTKVIEIVLTGKKTFETYETFLWHFSEFTFLCYEDMFFYDTFVLYCNDKQFKLKNFRRTSNDNLRKTMLRTYKNKNRNFCMMAFCKYLKLFKPFVEFRKKSGIVFDVFRSTVYSKSFREDYPLRLSQTMEGLANYLGITDTTNGDNFRSAIKRSIRKNDYIHEYLPNSRRRDAFCQSILDHRNCFSHVNKDGTYLQGEKNEQYAEILYTTIRVLIIKHLQEKQEKSEEVSS